MESASSVGQNVNNATREHVERSSISQNPRSFVMWLQEIACLKKPIYSAAWATSLHVAWLYLSSTESTLLAACCGVGCILLLADYSLHAYLRSLPPSEAPTPTKQEDLTPPYPFMDNLRTYDEICDLAHRSKQKIISIAHVLGDFRTRNPNKLTAVVAVGFITLGSFFNRISGAAVAYMLIVLILTVPVLERIPLFRQLCHASVIFISNYATLAYSILSRRSTRPIPSHQEQVEQLGERLQEAAKPKEEHKAAPVDTAFHRTLSSRLQQDAPLPQRGSAVSAKLAAPASDAEEDLAQSTAGRQRGSSQPFELDDGYQIITPEDASEAKKEN